MSNTLELVDPILAGRLERAQADLLERQGWTWDTYSRTSATFAEQDVYWQAYLHPPHWPTAANPRAVGFSIELRGQPFTQHGSMHMLQPDRNDKACAVDIQWPSAPGAAPAAFALEAAPVMAEHGLGFPIPGEFWHVQAWDPFGEYVDHHEPGPPAPPAASEEDEGMWNLLKARDRTALFAAPMMKTPSGAPFAISATWLRDGNMAQPYVDAGVEVVEYDLSAFLGIDLVGPVPHGDTGEWNATHFRNVIPTLGS